MKLNALGRAAMNSTARRLAQYYVASWFERLGGHVENGFVLEVGCGGGTGILIILQRFRAARVCGIDVDPKMLDRAQRRISSRRMSNAHLHACNVTSLVLPDATFDAVFDFGAIHLEPHWQQAIAEVRRVLKPGGRFYFELVSSRFLRLSYPLFMRGLKAMDAPQPGQFIHELERQGIIVGHNFIRPRVAALTGVVGDLIGVGYVLREPS